MIRLSANASSEQLLWIYIFESWDLAGAVIKKKHGWLINRVVGLLLFSAFVGNDPHHVLG
ncbi:MAG: hypothetical protein HQ557_17480 [Bacteroidetes bacterium]|nr:hypothetical protein [Bacteroidota bacterium]